MENIRNYRRALNGKKSLVVAFAIVTICNLLWLLDLEPGRYCKPFCITVSLIMGTFSFTYLYEGFNHICAILVNLKIWKRTKRALVYAVCALVMSFFPLMTFGSFSWIIFFGYMGFFFGMDIEGRSRDFENWPEWLQTTAKILSGIGTLIFIITMVIFCGRLIIL